jgi:hypothetical protein
MKKTMLALISFLSLLFFNCSSDTNNQASVIESNNPFVKKFAGSYLVEIKGLPISNKVEAYALAENGMAKWMFIEEDSNGQAKATSKKSGTWTATETQISITIEGNSGSIIEDYILTNGIFVNTISSERFLKNSY